jgi:hypothetical protein
VLDKTRREMPKPTRRFIWMGGRTHQQLIFLFLIWNLNLKMVFLPHKNSKLDGSVRETVALPCARGARQKP